MPSPVILAGSPSPQLIPSINSIGDSQRLILGHSTRDLEKSDELGSIPNDTINKKPASATIASATANISKGLIGVGEFECFYGYVEFLIF